MQIRKDTERQINGFFFTYAILAFAFNEGILEAFHSISKVFHLESMASNGCTNVLYLGEDDIEQKSFCLSLK